MFASYAKFCTSCSPVPFPICQTQGIKEGHLPVFDFRKPKILIFLSKKLLWITNLNVGKWFYFQWKVFSYLIKIPRLFYPSIEEQNVFSLPQNSLNFLKKIVFITCGLHTLKVLTMASVQGMWAGSICSPLLAASNTALAFLVKILSEEKKLSTLRWNRTHFLYYSNKKISIS